MKEIWLIRHGQSTANAGEPAGKHREIPLSRLGEQQALATARLVDKKPELIVVSPFLRAQQTAAPTIAKFPEVPVETWDGCGEFTYMAPKHFEGTVPATRKPFMDWYWSKLDPDYVDGDGAESFRFFTERTRSIWARLKARHEHFIVVFSHEQFLRSLQLMEAHPEFDVQERMEVFQRTPHLANCQVVTRMMHELSDFD